MSANPKVFDWASAKPVEPADSGFDWESATPVEPEKASIPRRALRSVEEVGRGLLDFPTYLKGSMANLMEGSKPLDETDQYDQWAEAANQRQQELAQQPDAEEETLIGTRGDVRNAMSSLPFSVVSMGGSLASRAAGAAVGCRRV